MLDTNICIYIINKKHTKLVKKIVSYKHEEIAISTIVYSELMYGVENSKHKEKNKDALLAFLTPFKILKFDIAAGECLAKIRHIQKNKGKMIGNMDMLIAAHAISKDVPLITNNMKEFSYIEGLKLENWIS